MDADDDQAVLRVLLGPGADLGERAKPVDAGVGPEVDEHDLPAQGLHRERLRVQPPGRAVEAGQPAFDGNDSVPDPKIFIVRHHDEGHSLTPGSPIGLENGAGVHPAPNGGCVHGGAHHAPVPQRAERRADLVEKSSGSSQAAKWPPLSALLK